MNTKAKTTGIRLLVLFYCIIIFQHFAARAQFKMNPGLEAVFVGTLIYLIYGFMRREPAARWTGIVFHALFQVLETVSLFYLLDPKMQEILFKDIPSSMAAFARQSVFVVFGFVTLINIAAVVHLWKNRLYFSGTGKQAEAVGEE